jgi:dipeptidyl aminopeptidase/acylaminoacyl peptidase
MPEDATPPTAWTPELLFKVRDVSQVRVSPDGKRVLFCVTDPVMTDEKSENVTQIYRANCDGSGRIQLTYAEHSSGNPQWSPDGTWIAFTSNRVGKEGKSNLFRMHADGGEAEQITDAKADIGSFAWSPDSSHIAYLMPDPKTEQEEKDEKAKADWRWHEENIKYNRLYLLPMQEDADGKREPRLLTTGDTHVGGEIAGSALDWSPDGKTIVFTRTRTPKANDWPTASVMRVDVESGEVTPLVETSAAVMQPLYSPDGRWIALTLSDDPPHWAGHLRIHLLPATGGALQSLPETPDGHPALLGWSDDGQRLTFLEPRGTTTQLYSLAIETGAITALNPPGGVYSDVRLNHARTVLGFTRQTSDTPEEAFVTSIATFSPTQVSQANADIPQLPLGKTEVVRWKSADGWEIEGLLTYPVDYKAGQRVPLLLVIHGGPAGVFQETFLAQPALYPYAVFAARGYAVLRPNPRGSSGYGREFRYANGRDWGGRDFQDIMTGVDHIIAQGVADPDRLGVMGWSYGGFMTSWTITQTHRFKAASVGAAVTNLMSFNGVTDIPDFVPDYFEAQSWEDLEAYRAHSAMFQVQGVTTPTLIQHPEADVRVPIPQGYELYNALKHQNVPVRMLVLPRQPHGPNEPKMVRKVMETNLEWFTKYLT